MTEFKFAPVEYFNHQKFKRFLKRIRHLGWKVNIYYLQDNSIGMDPFVIDINIKIKSIKHELWENNATHHYTINDKYTFDIPADAEYITKNDYFGYEWRDGPTNWIKIKRIGKWKMVRR